jgi:putative transposase
MREELLPGEIFYTSKEAQILIEMRRKEYITLGSHSSLGYRPPVPETIMVPTIQFRLFRLKLKEV